VNQDLEVALLMNAWNDAGKEIKSDTGRLIKRKKRQISR
jgi:hypothetical protein